MNNFLSIEQVRAQLNSQVKPNNNNVLNEQGKDFSSILKEKSELTFSKHANNRLTERNINLSTEQMDRLNLGKEEATQKGVKNSLVLVDDYAFIVNTQKNVVITAMDKNETKNNVFTNIDGAVIV